MANKLYIYGASGHGKVIADMARLGRFGDVVFVDDNRETDLLMGYPVASFANQHTSGQWVVGIGSNEVRKDVVNRLSGAHFVNVIHPTAILSKTTNWGTGNVVMAGAIINVDTTIGHHVILNTGCSIDHDCNLGDFVHIAPQVTLCGNVTIGSGTFIGAGSVVIPGISIGENCIIGAGSVVIRNVPSGSKMAGAPAKPI
jgi:acetyltransferase EpsM